MKKIVLSGKCIVTGAGSIEYLKDLDCKKSFIVTGGSSMKKSGVLDQVVNYLSGEGRKVCIYSGIKKNPTFEEVLDGLAQMSDFQPDMVVAVGGGSAMDAAKAMVLFYEFPELNFDNVLERNKAGLIPTQRTKTGLICVPSTSGTGSEVTRGTVVTNAKESLKVPIMTDCLRPDVAILDSAITMTMPPNIAAETGMDALTHAIEAYTNHSLDDFNEALCLAAIKGIIKWLPISYKEATLESREKIHNYQAMAGIGFANVGLGMVHGIAHSFGAMYNLAHGVTNAIILPFVLDYNKHDLVVAEKLKDLSYACHCDDINDEIKKLKMQLDIPHSFKELGVSEKEFKKSYDMVVDHSMLGATQVNPIKITRDVMEKMVNTVYYGTEVDF